MDRREALKKLAVGGGTVVAASTIVSSPVFALTAPTIPAPMWGGVLYDGMGAEFPGNGWVDPHLQAGECPGSATSMMVLTEGCVTVTVNGGSPEQQCGYSSAGHTPMVFNNVLSAAVGATFVFTVEYEATCTYTAGTATTSCTATFTAMKGVDAYDPETPSFVGASC